MDRSVHVVIVEDHAVLAEALDLSLSMKGFHVTAIRPTPTDTPSTLLASVLASDCDVLALDLHLGPAGDGSRLIQPLVRAGKPVVVLTGSIDPVLWGGCLARGAGAVLPKTAPLDVIAGVLSKAAQGLPVTSPARRMELIGMWKSRAAAESGVRERLNRLTPREVHVLNELVHGKRVREVAVDSFVSEATVRTQVKSILAKLQVNSQLAAVAMARDAGWGARTTAS